MPTTRSGKDSAMLAILLACDAKEGGAVGRSWKRPIAALLAAGHLRITSKRDIYRTSEEGRIEARRLAAAGVTPTSLGRPGRFAHDGDVKYGGAFEVAEGEVQRG